jgi:hypothetical protein
MTVALALLLWTVQLVARLHRTTAVSSAATDAARAVAEGRTPLDVRRRLGPGTEMTWDVEAGTVHVDLRVPAPHLPGLPDHVHRGATVRREVLR